MVTQQKVFKVLRKAVKRHGDKAVGKGGGGERIVDGDSERAGKGSERAVKGKWKGGERAVEKAVKGQWRRQRAKGRRTVDGDGVRHVVAELDAAGHPQVDED